MGPEAKGRILCGMFIIGILLILLMGTLAHDLGLFIK